MGLAIIIPGFTCSFTSLGKVTPGQSVPGTTPGTGGGTDSGGGSDSGGGTGGGGGTTTTWTEITKTTDVSQVHIAPSNSNMTTDALAQASCNKSYSCTWHKSSSTSLKTYFYEIPSGATELQITVPYIGANSAYGYPNSYLAKSNDLSLAQSASSGDKSTTIVPLLMQVSDSSGAAIDAAGTKYYQGDTANITIPTVSRFTAKYLCIRVSDSSKAEPTVEYK